MENDIKDKNGDLAEDTPLSDRDEALATKDEALDTQDGASDTEDNTSTTPDEQEESTSSKGKNQPEENSISADLIRGHINTIILRALYERDKYGYEIISDIESKSHGQYTLKQPTLYSALKRLENQGYIKAYWKTDDVTLGGRRKYFTLTESGKAITEKNLSEWEYSRTIIDSLISDKSFDFTNPAPTPVDFALLRDSVSRVPKVRGEEKPVNENNQAASAEPTAQQVLAQHTTETVDSVSCVQAVEYFQAIRTPEDKDAEDKNTEANKTEGAAPDGQAQPSANGNTTEGQATTNVSTAEGQTTIGENAAEMQTTSAGNAAEMQTVSNEAVTETHTALNEVINETQTSVTETVTETHAAANEHTAEAQPAATNADAAEEAARRRTHENYLKLISEPVRSDPTPAEDIVPGSENISSDKLIYANKPQTERDYKNLIDGIFFKTIYNGSVQTDYHSVQSERAQRSQSRQAASNAKLVDRGASDGVSITPSNESNASHATKTTYNKGLTLLKSSAVVLAILVIEAIFCFAFMGSLAVNWVYPAAILAIGIIQFAVFGILTLNGYGKHCVRPTGNGYISTCIILTIISILIIATLSFLLNMNTALVSDVMKMLIIPSITALNISVFAICFKLFLK